MQVGKLAGELAATVLKGADTSKIPIADVQDRVTKRLTLNANVLKGLKDPWHLTPSIREEVDVLVDDSGIHQQNRNKPPTK